MNLALRILIMSVSLLVFSSVVLMLIRRQLSESNSILWLLIAFMTLIVGFFPDSLSWLSSLIGISYAPALLFLVSILFLMLIEFRASLQLSKMDAKLNELAIELSILKEENRRICAITADKSKHDSEET